MDDTRSKQLYDFRDNPIAGQDANIEVTLGRITGYSSFLKYGWSQATPANVEVTIWPESGSIFIPDPLVEDIFSITSSSSLDTGGGGGAGAHTVLVTGVNADFEEISELIVMNGVTAVLTVNRYLILNEMEVMSADPTLKTNAGIIRARRQGQVALHMPAGYGAVTQMTYLVPKGKRWLIQNFTGSFGNSGFTLVGTRPVMRIYATNYDPAMPKFNVRRVVYEKSYMSREAMNSRSHGVEKIEITPGTFIEWTVLPVGSAANVFIRASTIIAPADIPLPV